MFIDALNALLLFMSISVTEIATGLMQGISRFNGPSRVAVITTLPLTDKLWICDDHGLLTHHSKEIATYYLDKKSWLTRLPRYSSDYDQLAFYPQPALELPEILVYASSSMRVPYQAWFTERPPNLVSEGPLAEWLNHASQLLVYESFAWQLGGNRPYGVVPSAIANYAVSAVASHIHSELYSATNTNTKLNVHAIIDAVLGISSTYEEGQRATGRLVLAEDILLQQRSFVTKFPSRTSPRLDNWKQVQKLLRAVSGTPFCLASNGDRIIGICENAGAKGIIRIDFEGGRGEILVDAKPVCTFHDGRLYALSLRPHLAEFDALRTEAGLSQERVPCSHPLSRAWLNPQFRAGMAAQS